MVKYMTMIVVNINEAKAKLSEFIELTASGERVLICKRNRPVAELRAIEPAREAPRPVGLMADRITVPATFFDALPDDLLEAFGAPAAGLHARVAERSPHYGASTGPTSKRGPKR
jgi:prevent-host-death family protein